MTILDTNVWVALFNQADSLHKQSILIAPALARPFIIPELIISEVCTVLARTADKTAADTFINHINETSNVEILATDIIAVQAVMKLFASAKHDGLSYVDVALLWLARTYTVITFDKKLERAIVKQTSR